MKPFGSIGPFEQIEETTDGFLDPSVFFENYVFKSRPILFRQVLAGDPHLSLWKTDENIYEIFKDSDDKVHVETRKKESRQQDILSMTMKDFLKRYQKEELYLVEEVPNLLRFVSFQLLFIIGEFDMIIFLLDRILLYQNLFNVNRHWIHFKLQ